jgi:hypothetical protein
LMSVGDPFTNNIMNSTFLQQTPTLRRSAGLARLAEPHGYRLEGDLVELQSRFTVLDQAAHQRQWALQLWACPQAPNSGTDLSGQMVAEVVLPPMSEVADEVEHLEMMAFATPPAGSGEHFMALALASGRPGQFDEVHDIAVYPRCRCFLQPRMRGAVGYHIQGERVELSVEQLENPRDRANCSGTLALELWALATPYAGGSFQGVPLAGVVIGSLSGQTEAATKCFDLPFSRPLAGTWHFVLMLREWTSAGYITRDFANFSNPVHYEPALTPAPREPEMLVPTEPGPIQPPKPERTVVTEPRPEVAVKRADEAVAASPRALASPDKEPAPLAPAPAELAPAATPSISVNQAAAEGLAALEGLSPKLARSIVNKRPFASLDDLRRVRGVTKTLLAKIRSKLKL